MELCVFRYSASKESTLGLLLEVSGTERKFLCYTIEDQHQTRKVYGETCIPQGVYTLKLRHHGGFHDRYKTKFSDFHKGMVEICDVPNFKDVLIHIGNTDDDTAGCLLLGDISHNNQSMNDFIGRSTQAYKRVYPLIASALERGEDVKIGYLNYS